MKRFISALALSAAALMTSTPASAISISFTPASSHIAIGDTVAIDVFINDLGDEILSAYDVNMLWNPAIAQATSVGALVGEFGLFMAGFGDPDGTPSSQGNVGVWLNSLESDADLAAAQSNSFRLFRLTLLGVADGVTTLAFGPDPDFQRNFVGREFLSLDVDIGTACIAVGTGTCAVPEPGTLALLSLGLLGLGLGRRRRL